MKSIWSFIYNYLIIPLFYIGVKILGLFNSKVRKGIKGRRRIFEELILNAARLDKSKKMIWFHSSSYGEFEQAKPIIKELKKNDDVNILVTFFSPSGYENSKKYPYADLISYIPLDTRLNAETFIKIANPNLAIMMRYDIWPNHIWALRKANIPCFIVDATMKEKSARKFPLIKSFHKYLYQNFTKILTVSQNDAKGFKNFGCTEDQLKAVGDTRFDRVYQRSANAKEKRLIRDDILKGKKVVVAGSTWEQDEDIIIPVFKKLASVDKNVLLIIAPHEPTILHLENIESEFIKLMDTIRFSFLNNYNKERIIIVDSIGILLTLYIYADIAFVGGGFKQNIHNVLEASVYGAPVLFGPKIDNSQEARELLKRGGGIMVNNKAEAYRHMRTLLSNDELRKTKGKISHKYVQENLGATEKILHEINKII
jgi:3-deoxy-D-manno-octulosonic-acid transferase